jgi:hypothetical protein
MTAAFRCTQNKDKKISNQIARSHGLIFLVTFFDEIKMQRKFFQNLFSCPSTMIIPPHNFLKKTFMASDKSRIFSRSASVDFDVKVFLLPIFFNLLVRGLIQIDIFWPRFLFPASFIIVWFPGYHSKILEKVEHFLEIFSASGVAVRLAGEIFRYI